MIDRAALRIVVLLTAAGLAACAPSAVVVVSRDYDPARIKSVALTPFPDFPGAAGSGNVATNSFEKYLLTTYSLVDADHADAIAIGALTDYTGSSDQTVMVDVPQEQSDPVYGSVVTTQHSRGQSVTSTENVVTGYATTETDQIVPETETVPAYAAMNVRLVDAKTNELLWSVSSGGSGDDLPGAVEAASASAMQVVAKKLKNLK
jgi:curli biogenesis system outer membrane secretion channel CsgG